MRLMMASLLSKILNDKKKRYALKSIDKQGNQGFIGETPRCRERKDWHIILEQLFLSS